MGCDIHAHVEIKLNGRWQNWSALNINRDYKLFGKIAKGVRMEVPEAYELKGLPDDVSDVVKNHIDYWNGDAHSKSYLTAKELVELGEWLEENGYDHQWIRFNLGYVYGSHIWDIEKYPEDFERKDVEDVRLVYWFDN